MQGMYIAVVWYITGELSNQTLKLRTNCLYEEIAFNGMKEIRFSKFRENKPHSEVASEISSSSSSLTD
jgi:hypothetical protein